MDVYPSVILVILILILLLLVFFVIIPQRNTIQMLLEKIDEKEEEINSKFSKIELLANNKFEEFKKNELNKFESIFDKEYKIKLDKWKIESELTIRQDAINRSQSVTLGKITEHLIPFSFNFPFNPKDIRFIGSPIDLIVFDGSSEEREQIDLYILEIKTGASSLTKKQRLIKDAVLSNRVYWRELNFDGLKENSDPKYFQQQKKDFSKKKVKFSSSPRSKNEYKDVDNQEYDRDYFSFEELLFLLSRDVSTVNLDKTTLRKILDANVHSRSDLFILTDKKMEKHYHETGQVISLESIFYNYECFDYLIENIHDFAREV